MNENNSAKILIPDHIGPPLTMQDCFNRAWEWVKTHGPCSSSGFCFYRNEQSLKCLYRNEERTNACLMGQLIPDSLYSPFDESKRASDILYTEGVSELFDLPLGTTVLASGVVLNGRVFLNALQACHDYVVGGISDKSTLESDYRTEVTKKLVELAKKYNLTVPNNE